MSMRPPASGFSTFRTNGVWVQSRDAVAPSAISIPSSSGSASPRVGIRMFEDHKFRLKGEVEVRGSDHLSTPPSLPVPTKSGPLQRGGDRFLAGFLKVEGPRLSRRGFFNARLVTLPPLQRGVLPCGGFS